MTLTAHGDRGDSVKNLYGLEGGAIGASKFLFWGVAFFVVTSAAALWLISPPRPRRAKVKTLVVLGSGTDPPTLPVDLGTLSTFTTRSQVATRQRCCASLQRFPSRPTTHVSMWLLRQMH